MTSGISTLSNLISPVLSCSGGVVVHEVRKKRTTPNDINAPATVFIANLSPANLHEFSQTATYAKIDTPGFVNPVMDVPLIPILPQEV
ncbi:hypothetical protein DAMNIGENAA_02940 [Desulforhabdus amnigena]|jgi:hypothetical protein|uniref:Uncharacterized protein n=1 Tax=Desulforhabdus amnigena TaxID=40218 RepID=A0A9W6D4A1_9BACT|nr:hypothetical protein DAMNIGENAA_02940 [Desulforhabdus amnigena]